MVAQPILEHKWPNDPGMESIIEGPERWTVDEMKHWYHDQSSQGGARKCGHCGSPEYDEWEHSIHFILRHSPLIWPEIIPELKAFRKLLDPSLWDGFDLQYGPQSMPGYTAQ